MLNQSRVHPIAQSNLFDVKRIDRFLINPNRPIATFKMNSQLTSTESYLRCFLKFKYMRNLFIMLHHDKVLNGISRGRGRILRDLRFSSWLQPPVA